MTPTQQETVNQYQLLMGRIRSRFQVIERVKSAKVNSLSARETVAFHLRKIVEGTAFGCLVACENGIKSIPRDAQGQWNADNIFARLDKRGVLPLPNPSTLRKASDEEQATDNIKFVVDGQPELCLTCSELREIYQRSHKWLHEENPYVSRSATDEKRDATLLWADVEKMKSLLSAHCIGLNGEMFFCILDDPADGQTKVFSASKATN